MVYKNVPGVFIEEVSLLPPSVVGVETGIPAFIGHTQQAETPGGKTITEPLRITSLREYEDNFGKAQPEDDLVVTINHTLGSDDKTVVSTKVEAAFGAAPAAPNKFNMYYALQLFFANGGGPCYIISVGDTSGNGPDVAKLKAGLAQLEGEDEPTMIVFPEAIYLTEANYFDLYNLALQQCADLKDRVTIIDVLQKEATINDDIQKVFRKDTTLDALKSTDNLLYETCKQTLNNISMTMPPSPAIAGVYARVDSDRGVWKAPANVGVSGVLGTGVKVTDADQNFMNIDATTGKSVNAIRPITGRGIVVWGARTLMGNSNEWRYINVRRFFNFVEESVKKASYQFVFEANDANTWVKVRAMIENFLTLQWRAGALMGAKPEQAFFVRVGLGQTMTPLDVLEGRMIVEIGMAVVRPAEFIILRFSHKMPEA